MRFPWSRVEGSAGHVDRPQTDGAAGPRPCPGLSKVLDKLEQRDKPQILDVGPCCGATAVYLAGKGARVSVAEVDPPAPVPTPTPVAPGKPDPQAAEEHLPPAVSLEYPDAAFDLVLVWELIDFIPPERLAEFGAELHRVLSASGWALILSQGAVKSRATAPERPPRYRVLADDRVLREATDGPPLARYGHPTREIERALAPLAIQGIHLQRNQMREFLVLKRA